MQMAGPAFMDYFLNGRSAGPAENRNPLGAAAPHGVFPCAGEDRWIAIAVHSDDDWQRLVRVMGAPSWAVTPELATLDGRLQHVDMIERRLAEWTAPQDAAALAAQLLAAGLDAAPVADMQDLLQDPQLAERGHFNELSHAAVGRHVVEANGLRFSAAPMRFTRPAPLLAGDSKEAYCELLGVSEAEFEELAAAGVVS
jgi:benzylsuccinate CoA-transferase BbsF subunit